MLTLGKRYRQSEEACEDHHVAKRPHFIKQRVSESTDYSEGDLTPPNNSSQTYETAFPQPQL